MNLDDKLININGRKYIIIENVEFDNKKYVYLVMNKYIYPTINAQVPYPTDVYEFCNCYRNLRKIEKPCTSQNVHRFKFEDFIYKYDETIARVQSILGKEGTMPKHCLAKKYFNPDRSINNTQLFNSEKMYEEECRIIEELLPEYLYEFPYQRVAERKEMF